MLIHSYLCGRRLDSIAIRTFADHIRDEPLVVLIYHPPDTSFIHGFIMRRVVGPFTAQPLRDYVDISCLLLDFHRKVSYLDEHYVTLQTLIRSGTEISSDSGSQITLWVVPGKFIH